MLRSAERHYRNQQRILAAALAVIRRAFGIGEPRRAVPMIAVFQHEAARDAAQSVSQMLAEQGANVRQVAQVNTQAIAGSTANGQPLLRLIVDDRELWQLEAATLTAVQDAARMGAQLAIAATPGAGWTRMVNPPCCKRCAVQSGKFFRFNDGFKRHPRCDCRHIPTTQALAREVEANPERLLDLGHIADLTVAEKHALAAGADFSAVVNGDAWMDAPLPPAVRRAFAESGNDQDRAIEDLRRAGYLI